jgi:hypothetical protein
MGPAGAVLFPWCPHVTPLLSPPRGIKAKARKHKVFRTPFRSSRLPFTHLGHK